MAHARDRGAGACVGGGTGVAAVGGPVDVVDVVVWESTTTFVHARDVNIARNLVGSDLLVADEAGRDVDRGGPSVAAIGGVGGANLLALTKVVPTHVHPPIEGRGCVVIDVGGLPVIRE